MNKHMLKSLISNKLVSLRIREEITIQGDKDLSHDLDNWIDQLDEPQKPIIPKFVAERIEEYKTYNTTLLNVYKVLGAKKDDVSIWVNDNLDLFARAWLDGYTIEQEKLYTVEIPNNGGFIVLAYINNAIKLVDGNKLPPGKFTKESIEWAGFGWVFEQKFAKEVKE